MGLFDYVRCDAPLPDGRPTPSDLFQTKDFDCPYMEHYVITTAGRLVKLKVLYSGPKEWSTPEDKDLNWHGWLNFYDGEYVTDNGQPYRGRVTLMNNGEHWGERGELLRWRLREFNAKFTDGQLVEIVQAPDGGC